ncbi:MAG TPA: hypothetical protein VJU61_16180, partial [Polyangiaceae bacterium]|nr:hypothetical protein [Polyangiaceae bacterium]
QVLEHSYDAAMLRWPVDLVLVPKEESAADDTFEVIVEALDRGGSVLAQSRVLTSYVLREAHILPLPLASCGGDAKSGLCEDDPGCLGPGCQTCLPSGCAATPVIEAAELPRSAPDGTAEAGVVETEPQSAMGSDAGAIDANARADTGTGAAAGGSPDAGAGGGNGIDASVGMSNPCTNACDPLATCSVVNGNPVCSCPAPYTTTNGGKTCVRGAMDGGGVPEAATPTSDAAMSVDAGSGKLPRVTSTEVDGPFTVTRLTSTAPGGWLVYPNELGLDGAKHPLFVFVPGAGTSAMNYQDHLNRWASFGIVIYGVARMVGDGTEVKAGVDWLIAQNSEPSSPLYQKLDTSKVGVGGHSGGSLSVFAYLPDPRVTTSIHFSGGSMDGSGSSKLRGPAMFLSGASDIAATNSERDFQNSKVPTFLATLQGADHVNSARVGLPASAAWLLWQLAGQGDQWKKEFLESGGKFQTGIYLTAQAKNW